MGVGAHSRCHYELLIDSARNIQTIKKVEQPRVLFGCVQDDSCVGVLSFWAGNENLFLAFTEKNAIQFRAQQCAERCDVKPDQGGNAGAE